VARILGGLPADGEVQIGAVLLPTGKRICAGTPAAGYNQGSGIAWMADQEAAAREYARAHPGVPLLWATDEPVPDVGRVWQELHEMAPETGLQPITLAFLGDTVLAMSDRDGLRGRPWDSGELADPYPVSAAAEVDTMALLTECWEGCLGLDDDDPEQFAKVSPFSREFPGLAPASDEPLSGAELAAALRMMRPARLGLVPASRPSDVLSKTGFAGSQRVRDPSRIHCRAAHLGGALWRGRIRGRFRRCPSACHAATPDPARCRPRRRRDLYHVQ
jgi:hypothetical protein